jgi:excisionase family DNA binding protein
VVRTNRKDRQVDDQVLVVDPDQACVMLNCSRDTLYDMLRNGELQSYREGRSRRITVASIKQRVERKVSAAKVFERARFPGGNNEEAAP